MTDGKPAREILARIAAGGRIELANEGSATIADADSMTPDDAAYLARGLLASAVALASVNPPREGALVGDASIPVEQFLVTSWTETGTPLLELTVVGVKLTFALSPRNAALLGMALVAQVQSTTSADDASSGPVH